MIKEFMETKTYIDIARAAIVFVGYQKSLLRHKMQCDVCKNLSEKTPCDIANYLLTTIANKFIELDKLCEDVDYE